VYNVLDGCDKLLLAPDTLHIDYIVSGMRALEAMTLADTIDEQAFDRCVTFIKREFQELTLDLAGKVQPKPLPDLEWGYVSDDFIYSLGNLSEHVLSLVKEIISKHQISNTHVDAVLKNLEIRRENLLGLVESSIKFAS
ncbi:MAG TPA: hypothetical protein VI913_03205, partial [Candidatus Peribacteraceae bacterium]|nr:hypothetical protein [Candidatus Peribacteraceae bacterium]